MRIIYILLMMSLTLSVSAGQFPSVNFTSLFHEADIVAILELESGKSVGVDSLSCGVVYTAKIKKVLKGEVKSATIGIGPYIGYRIGVNYLAYLKLEKNKADTAAYIIDNRCAEVHKNTHEVMSKGAGIFELENGVFDEAETVILVNKIYVDKSEKYWSYKTAIKDYFKIPLEEINLSVSE